jgi:segregation and condensation protein B
MTLDAQIEALLFYKATPLSKQKIQKLFAVSEAELDTAISNLRKRLSFGGTRVVETDTQIQLVTAPEVSDLIDSIRKQELKGDIGKAGAETLSIILYREPISRVEIDRIRGVNSSFIIRNLLVRGLITRESITGHGYQFRISPQLLQHLGVERKQDLPRFSEFMNAIDQFDSVNHE